ncbi:predicted protein [Botrytis cinerea T4]|uniref:Uncharacterized protein n=1 Tax=Botryotinia fuckeliana (strain T4) TaxID=999810 RepID=G2XSF2_BOTF4|nr:predicted protein [Botrytis cinerea T4]
MSEESKAQSPPFNLLKNTLSACYKFWKRNKQPHFNHPKQIIHYPTKGLASEYWVWYIERWISERQPKAKRSIRYINPSSSSNPKAHESPIQYSLLSQIDALANAIQISSTAYKSLYHTPTQFSNSSLQESCTRVDISSTVSKQVPSINPKPASSIDLIINSQAKNNQSIVFEVHKKKTQIDKIKSEQKTAFKIQKHCKIDQKRKKQQIQFRKFISSRKKEPIAKGSEKQIREIVSRNISSKALTRTRDCLIDKEKRVLESKVAFRLRKFEFEKEGKESKWVASIWHEEQKQLQAESFLN